MNRNRKLLGTLTGAALAVALVAPLPAQKLGTEFVLDGLNNPILLISPPGDTDRMFVVEEDIGRVRVIKNGSLLAMPFVDVGAQSSSGSEQGLLGMAFHPNYATNGYFYLSYTDNGGDTVISRWSVSAANPDVADPNSEFVILTQNQPFGNHNGGMIAFGPNDGYLYIGLGDGGSAGDPQNNGQNPNTFLGKMLRIDVDGGTPYAIPPSNPFVGNPSVLDEIWATGLRNPWRWAFHRKTGDMWIGDVGQNAREEIDFQPGNSAGGENYGWKIMEGTRCFSPSSGCNQTGLTLPIYDYQWSFTTNRTCVIGGYVYGGDEIPGLDGMYFFADWGSHEIWSMRYINGQVEEFLERTTEFNPGGGRTIRSIASFGEDAEGNLYVLDRNGGEIFRIVADLMDLSVNNLVAGQTVTASISNATPGQNVFFAYSTTGPGVTPVPQLGVYAGILNPQLAGTATANAAGTASISQALPISTQGAQIWIQAIENGNTSTLFEGTIQ